MRLQSCSLRHRLEKMWSLGRCCCPARYSLGRSCHASRVHSLRERRKSHQIVGRVVSRSRWHGCQSWVLCPQLLSAWLWTTSGPSWMPCFCLTDIAVLAACVAPHFQGFARGCLLHQGYFLQWRRRQMASEGPLLGPSGLACRDGSGLGSLVKWEPSSNISEVLWRECLFLLMKCALGPLCWQPRAPALPPQG